MTDGAEPTKRLLGDGYQGYLLNKRKAVFAALDKNPLLTPSSLAAILEIPSKDYPKEKAYLKKLKYEWKGYHRNERGSVRSVPDGVHSAFYRGVLPVDVVKAVGDKILGSGFGWVPSRNKNHALIFKHQLGRIRLFGTGTVELYVRKPANKGKAMQLFSYGLIQNGLIDSIAVLDKFQKGLLTRMHATFDVGQKLPYMKIDAFRDSHKFIFVSGDRTHPTSFEFMFEYNSEVEAARQLFVEFSEMLKGLGGSSEVKRLSQDYSR